MSKKTIIDSYLEYQDKYSKIYGNRAIVFMQVGSFYESYSTETEGYHLKELEQIINVKFTRRDNNTSEPASRKNPNLLGFPCVSLVKNLTILTDNGYTIVIFDQVVKNDVIVRVLQGVYSPGTYVADKTTRDAVYTMTAYIVEERQIRQSDLLAVGVTLIDVATGSSLVHEFYSSASDSQFALDELARMFQIFNPIETVVYFCPSSLQSNSESQIRAVLDLDRYQYQFFTYIDRKGNDKLNLLDENSFKISYQNDYLSKIYGIKYQAELSKNQSPIEVLDLEKKPYALVALLIMIKYINEHNVNLLKNLSYPTVYLHQRHLVLGNNAVGQLNVVDSNNLESYNKKIESLFDVVNKTCTPMGKRFLKDSLLNPLSQTAKGEILRRYGLIKNLMVSDLYKTVQQHLKNIFDVERLHRKIAIGVVTPYDFYNLDQYYQYVVKIIGVVKKNDGLKSLFEDRSVKEFLEYQADYNCQFNFKELQKITNFNDIENSIYNRGVNSQIDKIQDKIDYVWTVINAIIDFLKDLIKDGVRVSSKNLDTITIESNEREGYYLTLTKTRETLLRSRLAKFKKAIDIPLPDSSADVKNSTNIFSLATSDIVFKSLPKGKTKIFIAPLLKYTQNLTNYKRTLSRVVKTEFINTTGGYYTKHRGLLSKIATFVAEIDFLASGARCAADYYYCQPVIKSQEESVPSYIDAVAIRHPIIERLCEATEYVPNDVQLGNVPEKLNNNENHDEKSIEGKMAGRCLDGATPVMMWDGSVKRAREVVLGDRLMGDDSTARLVLGTCRGVGEMYQIVPEKGDPYTVNGPHILCLKSSGYKSVLWDKSRMRYRVIWIQDHVCKSKTFNIKNYATQEESNTAAKSFLAELPSDRGKIVHISVEDYFKKPVFWRINYYTYHARVEFSKKKVEIDPYILGHWLGDGTSSKPEITSADVEVVTYYEKHFKGTNLVVKKSAKYQYSITTGTQLGGKGKNSFWKSLQDYDLVKNKHIPDVYLKNNRKTRMAVLAGLIDSDGHNHGDRGIDIIQKNGRLADGIVSLARSLGFWCDKVKCKKTCTNSKNGPVTGTYYRMYIAGNDFSELPLLLEYKRPHPEKKTMRSDCSISGFKIKKLGVGKYYGFELDGNHRFLLGDFTVTHNSSVNNNEEKQVDKSFDKNSCKIFTKNGMLLFGLNSCGKTALSKAIGLSTILAQIGYYVPAERFEYEPYMALYARITGNDNILKGLSSFAVEMTELDAIIKRTSQNGENTLVIGDEVCRGTEDTSGVAIVASALIHLSQERSSFIFSSHLHKLPEIAEVKNLPNLRFNHLLVEYDTSRDCLIFNRKLADGPGPTVYGLTVAKYLIKNKSFVNTAEKIKNSLIDNTDYNKPIKKSNYNSKLLINYCNLCGYRPTGINSKELETHHINFQKDCAKNGRILDKPHLTKNKLYNLVVLCRKCHESVHKNQIVIKGFLDTLQGPIINYVSNNDLILDKIKKLKKRK